MDRLTHKSPPSGMGRLGEKPGGLRPIADVLPAVLAGIEVNMIVAALRKRADWLRSEYLAGGSFESLKLREDECRWLAQKLERGELP
jgi:hypothetical protein